MKWTAFLLATIISMSNARAIEWALEIKITKPDGTGFNEYYITSEENMFQIRGPKKDWICALKIDKVRVVDHLQDGEPVKLQNAFIGCRTPDGILLNTGASIIYSAGVAVERDTNLIVGRNNELSMRLIPCYNKYRDECIDWKAK